MKSDIETVFSAVADTFVRELNDSELKKAREEYCQTIAQELQLDQDTHLKFLQFKASDVNEIGKLILEYLVQVSPCDKKSSLLLVVRMLNTAIGTLLICGTGFKKFASFPNLNITDRQKALKKLEQSWLADLRQLYRVFYGVSVLHAYGVDVKDKLNVTWNALKYPGPEGVKDPTQCPNFWHPTFLDIKQNASKTVTLEYDVVVVGSGPGGGVMASELTKDGHRVLVVDKGVYVPPHQLPMTELEAFNTSFGKQGGFYSEDFGMQILAGSTWGGGSAVNWCASFQPPEKLRKEWAKKYGLDFFTSPEFQKHVEIVWNRLGVSDRVDHNAPNSLFLEGCKKLGIDGRLIMQNTAGSPHDCGFCTFGCPYQVKQASSITFLKDAAERGCHFIDGLEIERVVHKAGVARGVEGHKGDVLVKIKSKYVVLSCGSIWTPGLLLKSKIRGLNHHVGKHLWLHPVTLAYGVFSNKDVLPAKGSIMTAVSDVVADLDSEGYGAKLEIPASHPAMFASTISWKDGVLHKRRMVEWPHTTSVIVLTRDKDSEGRVWVDAEGKSRFDWKFGKFDSRSMLKGLEAAIKILLAAGATEVFTSQTALCEGFKRDPTMSVEEVLNSPEYEAYISKVKATGLETSKVTIFSAHQMGTCRMSTNPKNGAVDTHGRLWGMKNLYVCDTSVFPTASGVK